MQIALDMTLIGNSSIVLDERKLVLTRLDMVRAVHLYRAFVNPYVRDKPVAI
jgi:hypothetical protein